jgi:hypothetical protein
MRSLAASTALTNPIAHIADRQARSLPLLLAPLCGLLLATQPLSAQEAASSQQHEHGSLAEIGAKLSNPVSEVWALFTEFDLNFSDGDINQGGARVGGRMLF